MDRIATMLIGVVVLCSPSRAQTCVPEWSLPGPGGAPGGEVEAFTVFDDDGAGPHAPVLVAGGRFSAIGQTAANGVASWNGSTWTSLGSGVANNRIVLALAAFDEDGAGPLPPSLFAGGDFTQAGGVSAPGIARWDGQSWSALPLVNGPEGRCTALEVFDEDGDGPKAPALFVASTDFVRRWDGNTWSSTALPGSFQSALMVFDDGVFGKALFSSGPLRRWDGVAASMVGGANVGVECMGSFDPDGSGPLSSRLVVSGPFDSIGGTAAHMIAQWDGVQWGPLGSGLDGYARALTVFDEDGPGPQQPALFVTGVFVSAGGVLVNNVAKWDGQNWSALEGGAGLNGAGLALAVFDDAISGTTKPALYLGGGFGFAGGELAPNLTRWGCVSRAPAPCIGDASGDGVVNFIDITAVLANWGKTCP